MSARLLIIGLDGADGRTLEFYSDNAAALRVLRRSFESDDAYAKRLDLIEELLRELKDVDDGLPVMSAVTRPAFETTGAYIARLPHLLFR